MDGGYDFDSGDSDYNEGYYSWQHGGGFGTISMGSVFGALAGLILGSFLDDPSSRLWTIIIGSIGLIAGTYYGYLEQKKNRRKERERRLRGIK